MAKKLDALFAALVPSVVVTVGSDVMAAVRAEVNDNNRKKIVSVAVGLIDELESAKAQQVVRVREHRAAFEESLNKLKKLDRALAYADATGIFVPAVYLHQAMTGVRRLCTSLGCEVPSEKDDILQVPKGWEPKKA